ncbi:hypothetical protein LZG04_19720 [Saccharothrix sp. S26]|uniref:hypothetical protein n=1 Tax=Saccharothrix sp. S26 TaxID=2907215 RepID=UPI001F1B4DE7|nr:hypothetical protein [Saccharothrix sp. S26]MCE6997015.1 hypothetical protein [Saccharothrix sp. S26]
MNLRKTIAGAAIAVGSTAVVLGLGGTAQAATDLGAHTGPELEGELGHVANIADVVRIDTANPTGPVVNGPLVLGDDTGDAPLDVKVDIGR